MECREILIGGSSLIRERIPNYCGKAMLSVCDELEPISRRSRWLSNAPFKSVSLILRFGNTSGEPLIERINRRHAELEVAIDLKARDLEPLSFEDLRSEIRQATLRCLVAVANVYDLNGSVWEQMFAEK